MSPLVNTQGDLVTGGKGKADRLEVFFASVFTRKVSQASVLSEKLG